jgi:hypothetical protein
VIDLAVVHLFERGAFVRQRLFALAAI